MDIEFSKAAVTVLTGGSLGGLVYAYIKLRQLPQQTGRIVVENAEIAVTIGDKIFDRLQREIDSVRARNELLEKRLDATVKERNILLDRLAQNDRQMDSMHQKIKTLEAHLKAYEDRHSADPGFGPNGERRRRTDIPDGEE